MQNENWVLNSEFDEFKFGYDTGNIAGNTEKNIAEFFAEFDGQQQNGYDDDKPTVMTDMLQEQELHSQIQ